MESTENLSQDANAIAAKVQRTVGRAVSGAHATIDRVSSAAHPAVDRLAAGAHEAVNRVDGTAHRTARAVETTAQQWKETQSRVAERCYHQVREKPLATLGVALATGFVLALLCRRR